MRFLGSCEVCGKVSRNYRALSQHLRFQKDSEHQALKARWHAWRDEYRATLCCRKCGELFQITDKALKDRKRCDRCEALRQSLSKRAYEALSFDKPVDPRREDRNTGSKARWVPGYSPEVEWEVGDALYNEMSQSLDQGEDGGMIGFPTRDLRRRLHRLLEQSGQRLRLANGTEFLAFEDPDDGTWALAHQPTLAIGDLVEINGVECQVSDVRPIQAPYGLSQEVRLIQREAA